MKRPMKGLANVTITYNDGETLIKLALADISKETAQHIVSSCHALGLAMIKELDAQATASKPKAVRT